MTQKTYNINEWLKVMRYTEKFKIIPKKNKVKLFVGVSCLVVAIIPNGLGVVFYPLGFMLLGINKDYLIKKYENIKFKIRGF